MSKLNLNSVAISFLLTQFKNLALSFKATKEEEISEKDKAIIQALKRWDNSYRQNAIAFASALTGVDYSKYLGGGKSGYATGMVVVPTANRNSHSYTLNKPTCIVNGHQAWNPETNEIGNNLPDYDGDVVRLANSEEIDSFFDELSKKQSHHITDFLKNMISNIEIEVQK